MKEKQNTKLEATALLLFTIFLIGLLIGGDVKANGEIPMCKFMKMCKTYYKRYNVTTKRDCFVVEHRGCGDVLVRCKTKTYADKQQYYPFEDTNVEVTD